MRRTTRTRPSISGAERQAFSPPRSISVITIVLATAGVLAASTPALAGADYTAAQAAAGQKLYRSTCASCHGADLQGNIGPALAGAKFAAEARYQGLNADFLLRFMSAQMPQTSPGSLSAKQYIELLAFILQQNGFPAGDTELTDDQAKLSKLDFGGKAGATAHGAHEDAGNSGAN